LFHTNGQLSFRENCIDRGERDRLCKWYYENSQLKSRVNYIDGIRKGVLENFNEDGSVKIDN
jgi:antitoxin component YwqK of YwqJK toxin-antitoxin module